MPQRSNAASSAHDYAYMLMISQLSYPVVMYCHMQSVQDALEDDTKSSRIIAVRLVADRSKRNRGDG